MKTLFLAWQSPETRAWFPVGRLDADAKESKYIFKYIQGVENVYDLKFNDDGVTYGEVFLANEQQFSAFNLEFADTEILFRHFEDAEKECKALLERNLPLPAYDQCIKASHNFNLLNARGVIGVTERASYIGRVRALAKGCCEKYMEIAA